MEHSILSFMVDWKWYASRHGLDVQEAAAWTHFSEIGLKRNLDPNPLFNSNWYGEQYPDSRGIGCFQHFISSPVSQRLNPSPLFDSDWYLANNTDVRDAGLNPFMHFMQWGRNEGRYPNPWCAPTFAGPSNFNPTLYPDFSPEDLIGYIPNYTTIDRLMGGAEASAIFSPKTPLWVFPRLKPLQMENLVGQQVIVVGGRPEIFRDNIAYTAHGKVEPSEHIHAYQVRYAIAPAIVNAISAVGQPFLSFQDFKRFEHQIAGLLQGIPPASIDILIDKDAYIRVMGYLKNSALSDHRVVGLGSTYICRIQNLLHVALEEKNNTQPGKPDSAPKSELFSRWKQRFFSGNIAGGTE